MAAGSETWACASISCMDLGASGIQNSSKGSKPCSGNGSQHEFRARRTECSVRQPSSDGESDNHQNGPIDFFPPCLVHANSRGKEGRMNVGIARPPFNTSRYCVCPYFNKDNLCFILCNLLGHRYP